MFNTGPAFNIFLRLCNFHMGPFVVNKYTAPGVRTIIRYGSLSVAQTKKHSNTLLPPSTVVHVLFVDSPSTGCGVHVLGPTTSGEDEGTRELDRQEQGRRERAGSY